MNESTVVRDHPYDVDDIDAMIGEAAALADLPQIMAASDRRAVEEYLAAHSRDHILADRERIVAAATVGPPRSARDNYIAHLTARVQRLLAAQDRAEREGDAEARRDAQDGLRRIQRAVDFMAEVDTMHGPDAHGVDYGGITYAVPPISPR